jgi:allantoin racemase
MKFAWSLGMVEDASGRVDKPQRLWQILSDYAATVVGPGDSVSLRFSAHPSLSTQTYLGAVNAVVTVRDVLACQDEGFDGVMLAGSIDPGLDEARSVADIPVVGVTEAAMAISGFIGRRAGIVTVKSAADRLSFARIIEDVIVKYGCRDRLLRHRPVRPISDSWADGYRAYNQALDGDGSAFLAGFDAIGSELIADGADVIVCGNQLFGPLLHHLGRRAFMAEGVPVVCNVAAGLKALQVLVSMRQVLGLRKSSVGVFHPPSVAAERSVPSWLQASE